jgi:hypothetical protein
MKPIRLLSFFCVGLLGLSGCADNTTSYFNSQVKPDLSRETWLKSVNLDPNQWSTNADDWFKNGKSSPFEKMDNHAPMSSAISTMSVRVPDFTTLKVEGRMHIQLVGRQEHNSVYIYGPNDAVRQVIVDVDGNTVYIHEPKDCKGSYMDKVIVRVGLKNINNLIVAGDTNVEGREVTSDNLCVKSSSSGDMYLAGYMNLSNIHQAGSGALTFYGAETPALDIKVNNVHGTVNVSGRVGVHYLVNNGGVINVIGADSDALSIQATGHSRTAIAGYVNLKKITASNQSQVYAYWVDSNGAYVSAYNDAHIGLAGAVKNINIDATGSARFDGQYLRGDNVFVRTRDWAHANVNASKKLFGAAYEHSSIYFFGTPNIVSRYTSRDAVVIPVWGDTPNLPSTNLPPPAYKSMGNEPPPPAHRKRSYKDDGYLK